MENLLTFTADNIASTLHISYIKPFRGKDKFYSKPISAATFNKYDRQDLFDYILNPEYSNRFMTFEPQISYIMNGPKYLISNKKLTEEEYYKLLTYIENGSCCYEFVKKGPKPEECWAIIKTCNGLNPSRDIDYHWVENTADSEKFLTKTLFKKKANKIAENIADRLFNIGIGTVKKIYTDKQKFIKDYEKLSGKTPNC